MKILFDTNMVLDVMLDREPFAEPAGKLMSFVESGKISGLLCATTPNQYQNSETALPNMLEVTLTILYTIFVYNLFHGDEYVEKYHIKR